MAKLTVAFSKAPHGIEGIGSKLIRWFDGGRPYSHALLILDDKTVFEASEGGCVELSLTDFLKQRVIVKQYDFTLSDTQKIKLDAFIEGCKGKEYSYLQLFAIVLVKWFGIYPWLFLNETKKYICSELVAEVLNYISGFTFSERLDLITPGELDDAIGGFVEHVRSVPPIE